MRKYSIIIFLFVSIIANAQTIAVSSFKLLESDLTANTTGTMEKDQNGETAALLKVVTTQTGFTFDCGSLGIVKTVQKPSEIWVYVPRGVKKMTISHPQLGLLRDYYFPISINAACTYELQLTTGTVQTIVRQAANSQYLVLKVNPADAVVEVNNEILPTADGIAQKFVKFGTYEYRVQAPDYHTAAGKVTVDDPNNKKVLEISLLPAFGWIEFQDDKELNGAQVFIDNALAGTIPMKSRNLASGQHNVKIVKNLYQPYSQTVMVSDNQTTTIRPQLTADFSTVTINVGNDADIYINEEKKGTGTWTGRLGTGAYLLEAKKEGHQSTSVNVDISSDQSTRTINLPQPTPIYGSVNITSTPSMADVYIDDKLVGQTPLFIAEILSGRHSVTINHKGYENYKGEVAVTENGNTPINVTLEKERQKQEGAKILDGKDRDQQLSQEAYAAYERAKQKNAKDNNMKKRLAKADYQKVVDLLSEKSSRTKDEDNMLKYGMHYLMFSAYLDKDVSKAKSYAEKILAIDPLYDPALQVKALK